MPLCCFENLCSKNGRRKFPVQTNRKFSTDHSFLLPNLWWNSWTHLFSSLTSIILLKCMVTDKQASRSYSQPMLSIGWFTSLLHFPMEFPTPNLEVHGKSNSSVCYSSSVLENMWGITVGFWQPPGKMLITKTANQKNKQRANGSNALANFRGKTHSEAMPGRRCVLKLERS